LLPLLVVIMVGLVGFGDEIEEWKSGVPAAGDASAGNASAGNGAAAAAETAEAIEELAVRIDGCRCSRKSGQLDVDATQIGSRIELGLRFASGGVVLTANPETAPPSRVESRRMALGLACSGAKAIVAWEDRATAWSSKTGEALWTVPLPSNYRAKRPGSKKSGMHVKCRRMRIRKGRVLVPTVAGAMPLDVETGELLRR